MTTLLMHYCLRVNFIEINVVTAANVCTFLTLTNLKNPGINQ